VKPLPTPSRSASIWWPGRRPRVSRRKSSSFNRSWTLTCATLPLLCVLISSIQYPQPRLLLLWLRNSSSYPIKSFSTFQTSNTCCYNSRSHGEDWMPGGIG
jgi:hypothetical protein